MGLEWMNTAHTINYHFTHRTACELFLQGFWTTVRVFARPVYDG